MFLQLFVRIPKTRIHHLYVRANYKQPLCTLAQISNWTPPPTPQTCNVGGLHSICARRKLSFSSLRHRPSSVNPWFQRKLNIEGYSYFKLLTDWYMLCCIDMLDTSNSVCYSLSLLKQSSRDVIYFDLM